MSIWCGKSRTMQANSVGVRALRASCLTLLLAAGTASATELTWRPLSPSFGGDPLNATHLYNSAQIQNVYRPKVDTRQPTEQEQFLSSVRSRVYSRLSAQLTEMIFGENRQEKGTIVLGDQTVSYERLGNEIVVNLTQGGQTTTLRVPVSTVAP